MTEAQANEAMERDEHKHFLKPEQEVRNYYLAPIDIGRMLGVTNKTVINRCVKLASTGFVIPNIVKERIRTYSLSPLARNNAKEILATLSTD